MIHRLFISIMCLLAVGCTSLRPFAMVEDGTPAKIVVCSDDMVIETAVSIFSGDLERISGKVPDMVCIGQEGVCESVHANGPAVIVGLVSDMEALLKEAGVACDSIAGKWETYVMARRGNSLYIAGSDPRGAAYGLMELSSRMGVSPWEWWADVKTRPAGNLGIALDRDVCSSPSVRYRGIFINDEDFCFVPWSASYDSQSRPGDVGPATYSKVFELLMRLKANTVWPAMHPSTTAFYKVPGNKEAAGKYGIVVGTSHCEPMMRNNVGEWDGSFGEYDFSVNRAGVMAYWRERVEELAGDEVIYTLGMRGIHDGKMAGAVTLQEQTDLTAEVIAAQRQLIDSLSAAGRHAPQCFVPYKEVLDIYENGLEVPDDVTLVWCDDNYGHIMRLPDERECMRSGGSGIYYHVSYWGTPHDYLWIASTQPALMVSEMKRAWDCGAAQIWILNAGDIKPAEYLTDLFLDMAWDISSVSMENSGKHLESWLCECFGNKAGKDAFGIMKGYYRLNAERKPEHMGWSRTQQPHFPGGFTPVYDTEYTEKEADERLSDFDSLCRRADAVENRLPEDLLDAWFQLVEYPLKAASAMNRKFLCLQYGSLADSQAAYDEIRSLTDEYNSLGNGKWEGMMNMSPRNLPVFSAPANHVETEYGPVADVLAAVSGGDGKCGNGVRIPGLGYSDHSLSVPAGETAEFRINCRDSWTDAEAVFCFVPRFPAGGDRLRVEAAVDGCSLGVFDLKRDFVSEEWKTDILRNQTRFSAKLSLAPGSHTLTVRPLDEAVVIDGIFVCTADGRQPYRFDTGK